MGLPVLVLLGIALAAAYLFVDLPGAKAALVAVIMLGVTERVFTVLAKKSYRVKRSLDTWRVFTGVPEDNALSVENAGRLPIHALHVIDYTDLNIAPEQSHPAIYPLEPGGKGLLRYQLYGRKRGKYKIGPTSVRYSGPLGYDGFQIEENTLHEVIVFPNLLRIANMPFKSTQPYGAIRNRWPIFEDPSIITGLRDYQQGDEIKRINWKVSAKYDKLYVNNFQPSISSGSMIALDLLEDDYQFKNRDYHVERAVELAASLVQELFVLRQEIGFSTNCRIDREENFLRTGVSKGEAHFTGILTQLSIVDTARKLLFRDIFDPANSPLPWGTSLYVITPRLDETALFRLIDFQRAGHSVTVINVGPEIRHELSLWTIGFQSFYADFQGNLIHLMRI
jgi:uncharacterized protein (DUF58 family)